MAMTAGKYVATYVALVAFTSLTFGLSFVRSGPFELPIAMLIAAAKGGIVALFFMHLVEQRFSNRFVFVVGLLFFALIVGISSTDFLFRDTELIPPTTG